MPGPTTEVLNDDVKELKGEIRDIRGDLNVLKADVHQVAVSLAELRAEVRVSLAVAKWAGALLVTTILGVGVAGGVAGVWWASNITAEVRHLAGVVAAEKAAPRPSPAPRGN